jgi:hypothetical protein
VTSACWHTPSKTEPATRNSNVNRDGGGGGVSCGQAISLSIHPTPSSMKIHPGGGSSKEAAGRVCTGFWRRRRNRAGDGNCALCMASCRRHPRPAWEPRSSGTWGLRAQQPQRHTRGSDALFSPTPHIPSPRPGGGVPQGEKPPLLKSGNP